MHFAINVILKALTFYVLQSHQKTRIFWKPKSRNIWNISQFFSFWSKFKYPRNYVALVDSDPLISIRSLVYWRKPVEVEWWTFEESKNSKFYCVEILTCTDFHIFSLIDLTLSVVNFACCNKFNDIAFAVLCRQKKIENKERKRN